MKYLYIIILLTFGLGQDYSLSFDGLDDYVSISDNIGGTSEITISAWIKEPGFHEHIIGKINE